MTEVTRTYTPKAYTLKIPFGITLIAFAISYWLLSDNPNHWSGAALPAYSVFFAVGAAFLAFVHGVILPNYYLEAKEDLKKHVNGIASNHNNAKILEYIQRFFDHLNVVRFAYIAAVFVVAILSIFHLKFFVLALHFLLCFLFISGFGAAAHVHGTLGKIKKS